MRTAVIAPLTALVLLAACSGQNHAPLEDEPHAHSGPQTDASDGELTEAQRAYAEVNDRMHAGMANISTDPDVAFMEGMLAHHRGAVEMSEVALKYGSDEQVHDLARRIIDAQAAEIEEMETWLKAREPQ